MSKKRYRPKEIVCMLRDAADLTSQDKPVTHVIKPLKVSEVTCYNWLRIKVA